MPPMSLEKEGLRCSKILNINLQNRRNPLYKANAAVNIKIKSELVAT